MVTTFAFPPLQVNLLFFLHIFQFPWMKLNERPMILRGHLVHFWGLHFWQNNKTSSVSMLSNHPKSKVCNWIQVFVRRKVDRFMETWYQERAWTMSYFVLPSGHSHELPKVSACPFVLREMSSSVLQDVEFSGGMDEF